MPKFRCPFCNSEMEVAPQEAYRHMQIDNVMVERIKAMHPEWTATNGICPRCLEEFRRTATS